MEISAYNFYKYLLGANVCVNLIEALLDVGMWGWSDWEVISHWSETILIGNVVDGDQLTLWACVRVGASLYECFRLVCALAYRLDVAALLRDDVVASFIAIKLFKESHKYYLCMYLVCASNQKSKPSLLQM